MVLNLQRAVELERERERNKPPSTVPYQKSHYEIMCERLQQEALEAKRFRQQKNAQLLQICIETTARAETDSKIRKEAKEREFVEKVRQRDINTAEKEARRDRERQQEFENWAAQAASITSNKNSSKSPSKWVSNAISSPMPVVVQPSKVPVKRSKVPTVVHRSTVSVVVPNSAMPAVVPASAVPIVVEKPVVPIVVEKPVVPVVVEKPVVPIVVEKPVVPVVVQKPVLEPCNQTTKNFCQSPPDNPPLPTLSSSSNIKRSETPIDYYVTKTVQLSNYRPIQPEKYLSRPAIPPQHYFLNF